MAVTDKALRELSRLSNAEALAVLDALESKRRKQHFIRYFEPYDKQQAILKRFTADKKIFGLLGGNRSGKSELGSFIAVAWALGIKYFEGEPTYEFVRTLPIPDPPNNIWIVGLDYGTLRDVIWHEKLQVGRNHPPFLPQDPAVVTSVIENNGNFQITFANGSIITGKSADSGREKFQGASVDLVWIDEEPEEEIFDECYQRTIDCAGKILITLTPLVDTSSGIRKPWVFDLYEDFKKGKKDLEFCTLSILDNPFVPKDEKDKAIEKWAGHPEEQARLHGGFVRRSGLVYPQWDPKKHLIPRFDIPGTWRRIVSIDPAATGPTAALWAAVSLTDDVYLYREYEESNLIVSEHAKAIRIRNGADPIDQWLLDPTWGSQRNAETHKTGAQLYRDANIPVRLPEVGEDFGLNVSREYLQATVTTGSRHPKVYVFNDLNRFRFEIEHYTWDHYSRGEMKGLSKEKPRKRDDHLINAWQYLCATRPRAPYRFREPSMTDEQKMQKIRNNSYSWEEAI